MRVFVFLIVFMTIVDGALAGFLPKAFEANIEQVVYSVIQNKENKTPVHMKYLFPNNIYFDVKGENPVTYVCNKKTTWKYNPPFDPSEEKGEVLIGDSSRYCYVKLFDALSNGLKDNKIYLVKKDEKKADLNFMQDAQAQLNIKEVKIQFKGTISAKTGLNDIEQMEVYYLDKKNPVIFRFKNINQSIKLTEKDFDFKIPANTNINKF